MANKGRPAIVGYRKPISVGFDDVTYEKIQELAEKNGNSFAGQVRILVEWGLEQDD